MTSLKAKHASGLLTAGAATFKPAGEVQRGMQPLTLAGEKHGLLYVPASYDESQPVALAVLLHGAGAAAQQGLSLLQPYADSANILLIAPAASATTWDIIVNKAFGPDVTKIDLALACAFEKFAINPQHVAIGGFSDGASYALSLGLANGKIFTHIIAFSPAFAYSLVRKGKPAIFISHGVADPVLPIDPCSRRIAPELRKEGLDITFMEFAGGHTVPEPIAERAVAWFLKDSA